MRSMLRYLDPTRPIKWVMGGGKDEDNSFKERRLVVVLSTSPLIGEWAGGSDYEILDWRGEGVKLEEGIEELCSGVGSGVVLCWNRVLVSQLMGRGANVIAVLNTVDELAAPEPHIQNVKNITVKASKTAVRNALKRLLGNREDCPVVVAASDPDEIEMPSKCPIAPLLAPFTNRNTLVCLQAISENLLYRSCEDKYRTLFASSDRFENTVGKHPTAVEVLKFLGFELREDDEGLQWVHPNTPIDVEAVQTVLDAVNTALDNWTRGGEPGLDEL
eukprot:TRINITY_DN13501_c0_g1_i1.p1 TRINITY_DN13501_c0_g1~~TRINITY_DN13501_c0_g1_i1.p1  ORF type:complete len:295 (+),score=49.76 TRINITY_DN13501_c0_g1_i1:64-885(+)